MPDQLVEWSWDIELVDVDNDWDLDILVSCKLCATSYLFRNDGTGHFTDAPNALPHFANNYDARADGHRRRRLSRSRDDQRRRRAARATCFDQPAATARSPTRPSTRLTGTANPGADDNAAVLLDVDNDGDADMLVASLSGPDRLLLNDGTGHFTLAAGSATPNDTPGSLGIAVGDLDGDGRLDVVQAQGEVAFPEKVQLATSAGRDRHRAAGRRASSSVADRRRASARASTIIRARRASHDWQRSCGSTAGGTEVDDALVRRVPVERRRCPPSWRSRYQVCATDRRGNMACSADAAISVGAPMTPTHGDGAGDDDGKPGGCCDAGARGGCDAGARRGSLPSRGCSSLLRQCQKPIERPTLR